MGGDDALGSLVEGAEHQARFPLPRTHEHRNAVHLREGDVGPQGEHVRGAVLAVDDDEVQAGHGQHLDDVLARHPHQCTNEVLAVLQPTLQRPRGRGVTAHGAPLRYVGPPAATQLPSMRMPLY